MVEIRQATQADIEAFYGKKPIYSMRGVVGLEDGIPIGIGGVYQAGGKFIAFCELKPEARRHRKYILKAARLALSIADRYDTVYAILSATEPGARRFVEHLGFKHITGDTFARGRE